VCSKITDISKKISIAWKKLKPEDREKWNLIAKKDKVGVFNILQSLLVTNGP